jgi:hypothetical protein
MKVLKGIKNIYWSTIIYFRWQKTRRYLSQGKRFELIINEFETGPQERKVREGSEQADTEAHHNGDDELLMNFPRL